MISHKLCEFVDRVMEKHTIDDQDIKSLQRDILQEGLMTRDVVDVLIALDRAVPDQAEGFADILVAVIVDYAVWESRPTGVIDRDKAHWLVTTLSAGIGPTKTASRIAFEIVRESQSCDEALLSFALLKSHARVASFSQERMLLAS